MAVRICLIAMAASIVVPFAFFAFAQPSPEDAVTVPRLLPEHASQEAHDGAVLYHFHCAVCHGLTGRGFQEAVTAFPLDHRACIRCHRTANPAVMPTDRVRPNDAFDVGRAPPLLGPDHDPGPLAERAALVAYLRATMPRPFPGSLSDDEYRALAAFLRTLWAEDGIVDAPHGP